MKLIQNMDFEDAETEKSRQEVCLGNGKETISEDDRELPLTQLEFSKFQNVSHLSIFIEGNESESEVTQLDRLILFGTPLKGLNLSKLQKVPRRRRKGKRHFFKSPKSSQKNREALQNEILFQCIRKEAEGERFDFAKWKTLYYQTKLQLSPETLQPLVTRYMEGLQWTFSYYYKGCMSWSWYYDFFYAPLASDLVAVPFTERIQFQLSSPLSPLMHLLCVIPPHQKSLLPLELQPFVDQLMEENPEVDIELDKAPWEWVVRVSLPSPSKIAEIIQAVKWENLTETEKERNSEGSLLICGKNTEE